MLDYIPLIPTSPLKLFLSLWVLLPAYEGEAIVYLALCEYLIKLEEYVHSALTFVITGSLTWCMTNLAKFVQANKGNVSSDALPKLIDLSRKVSESLELEVKIRKKLEGSKEGVEPQGDDGYTDYPEKDKPTLTRRQFSGDADNLPSKQSASRISQRPSQNP